MAGGTGLALQLGHRVSVDFDFFTDRSFEAQRLIQQLAALSCGFQLERSAPGTILGFVGETKFSIFEYHYPLLKPAIRFMDVALASITDIAAMKLAAIADRGSRRDFIDLYVIAALEKHVSLEEVFALYDEKFRVLHQNKLHLLKSLGYFEDAEKEHMPEMLRAIVWEDVKTFFQNEAARISKQLLAT